MINFRYINSNAHTHVYIYIYILIILKWEWNQVSFGIKDQKFCTKIYSHYYLSMRNIIPVEEWFNVSSS